MFIWLSDRSTLEHYFDGLQETRCAIEAAFASASHVPGHCVRCQGFRLMRHAKPIDGSWSDLRENIVCECGFNGRLRMIYDILVDQILMSKGSVVLYERITPLFVALSEIRPDIVGCEYLGANRCGGTKYPVAGVMVRHEDMLASSFEDSSIELLFHGDVLEHIASPQEALSDNWRILRPGGKLYFTTPFYCIDNHVVRAKISDGSIRHILPPSYHGNPVSDGGSLVFTEFGWPLIDNIRDAGFSEVSVGLYYDPLQGIVSNNNPYREGHMWPLIFRAVK